MKRRIISAVVGIILLLLCVDALAQTERIVVAGGDNFMPLIFRNAAGEPDGMDVDLWQLWSKKTGIKVELQLMDWSKAIPLLRKGEVDVVDGVTPTPTRAQFLDFSTPYGEVSTHIYFHESIGGVKNLDDLAGFPVGIIKGTNVVEFLQKRAPELRLVPYVNHEQMVQAAQDGGLRVFVGEEPIIPFFVARAGERIGFRRTEKPLLISELRMAVRKGNSDLLARIEQGLAAITPAEKKRIVAAWTGVSFVSRVPWQWLFFGAGLLTLGTLLLITWNTQLRRRVTEATATLRGSEEQYRVVVDNANDGIVIIQDGVIKFANPRAIEMTGFSSNELATMPFTDLVVQEDKELILERYKAGIAGEDVPGNYSFRLRNRYGEDFWLDTNVVLIDWNGQPAAMYFIRDITEQKRLEAQLQHAQKMEAVGILAGGVAHDLNNILSGLVAYPELLLLDISEKSPLRKPILAIKDSGEKAASVVQDLLTLARRGVTITDVVNLNDIISEYLKSPEHGRLQASHSGLEFDVHLNTELLNILGSPIHLSKTVTNLVFNAIEAMPDVGKILISTDNQYIDRPIRGYEDVREGDYVVLSVVDSGIGISPEDLARVFEPFYTKKVMGRSGTGLGMAVVWGTVKDHNGYIDIQSTPGKGTRCDLYFPVTRREPAEKRVTVSIDEYTGSESILVVDDIEEQREIACQLLTKLGYSATTVSSGEEAIEYMKNNSVDLIVLDMIMDPGLDGLDTYKEILELHSGQKAIIASGFSETERVKEAQRLGAGAYIKKPYVLEKIGMAVRTELDK